MRELPLIERKAILAESFSQTEPGSASRLSEHIEGRGGKSLRKPASSGPKEWFQNCVLAAIHRAVVTRGQDKMREYSRNLSLAGFTTPEKGIRGIGALLLGYYDGGKLRYAGRAARVFRTNSSGAAGSAGAVVEKRDRFHQGSCRGAAEGHMGQAGAGCAISFLFLDAG